MHTTSRHSVSQILSTQIRVDLFYLQFVYLPYDKMKSLQCLIHCPSALEAAYSALRCHFLSAC